MVINSEKVIFFGLTLVVQTLLAKPPVIDFPKLSKEVEPVYQEAFKKGAFWSYFKKGREELYQMAHTLLNQDYKKVLKDKLFEKLDDFKFLKRGINAANIQGKIEDRKCFWNPYKGFLEDLSKIEKNLKKTVENFRALISQMRWDRLFLQLSSQNGLTTTIEAPPNGNEFKYFIENVTKNVLKFMVKIDKNQEEQNIQTVLDFENNEIGPLSNIFPSISEEKMQKLIERIQKFQKNTIEYQKQMREMVQSISQKKEEIWNFLEEVSSYPQIQLKDDMQKYIKRTEFDNNLDFLLPAPSGDQLRALQQVISTFFPSRTGCLEAWTAVPGNLATALSTGLGNEDPCDDFSILMRVLLFLLGEIHEQVDLFNGSKSPEDVLETVLTRWLDKAYCREEISLCDYSLIAKGCDKTFEIKLIVDENPTEKNKGTVDSNDLRQKIHALLKEIVNSFIKKRTNKTLSIKKD